MGDEVDGNTDEQVRAQLNELREAVLHDWATVVESHAGMIRTMQQSLSWKVTRPLRLARSYQFKVREVGMLNATRIAAEMVVDKVGSRR